jgi:hypothetical protein
VQTACARAGEVLAGAPLDNGDVDARQRQLTRQHQPRRTSSDDHHRMVGHRHTPVVPAATNSAARSPHGDNNTRISRDSVGSGFGRRFYGMTRVLKQSPYSPHIKARGIGILLSGYFRGRAETCGISFVMSPYGGTPLTRNVYQSEP